MPKVRRGLPGAEVAHWRSVYEKTPYRDLPWYSPTPYPWIATSVRNGWLPRGARVLDIGCGAGTNSLFLAREGYRTHGIDLAPAAITAARERAARAGLSIDFRVGDALRLPFPRGRFGGAVDVGCFHTLPTGLWSAYASEIARVLRPKARLSIAWAAREFTASQGPPHRPSVADGIGGLEPLFQVLRVEFQPGRRGRIPAYLALLERRSAPQPPPR